VVRAARSTKGVSLSLNTVIVAVLCLMVLAILGYIVMQKSGQFSSGVNTCEEPGIRICATSCANPEYPVRMPSYNCPVDLGGNERVCCGKL